MTLTGVKLEGPNVTVCGSVGSVIHPPHSIPDMNHDLPGQETENRKILPSAGGRTYFTVHKHGVGPGTKIVRFFNSTVGIIDQILGLVTGLSVVKALTMRKRHRG